MIDLKALESIVVTQVDYRIKSQLGERYPDLNVTSDISDAPAEFPNICLYEENEQETGNDLNNQTVNAVRSYFHVVVTTNTSRADAMYIRGFVLNIMKHLRYTLTSSDYVKRNNTHIFSMHFRRTVCPGDEF